MTTTWGVAAVAFVLGIAGTASAQELKIEKAVVAAGKLVVTGTTAKPNQVVEIVNTGDRTISLRNRRFGFSLAYLPDDCILQLKVENEQVEGIVVTGCLRRGNNGKDGRDGKDGMAGRDGKDGKDGRDGKPGKDGKDGKDGFVYGSLAGDGTTFKCWPSDLIGLWFIRNYPSRNSRTIAHIVPDRAPGSSTLKLTEPDDPLRAEKPEGPALTRSAEFDGEKLYVLDRDSKRRNGVQGEMAGDCKSIVWRKADAMLHTWER
jgi:hypothetical protein